MYIFIVDVDERVGYVDVRVYVCGSMVYTSRVWYVLSERGEGQKGNIWSL